MELIVKILENLDDIRVLLFYYWLETCLVIYVGLGLLGIRLNVKNLLIPGLVSAVFLYFLRGFYSAFNIPLGTHTFFITTFIGITIMTLLNKKPAVAFTAAFLGIAVLTIGEAITTPAFYNSFNMPFKELWKNPWLHILSGYVTDILIIITAFLVKFKGIVLIDFRRLDKHISGAENGKE